MTRTNITRRIAAITGAAALTVGGFAVADVATTATAPQAAAASFSTAGLPLLKNGSEGAAVKALQGILVEHDADIEIDGKFGPATEGAVKDFQNKKGIAADGVVGPDTWGVLIDTVRPGDSGADVRSVQRLVGADIDGKFGPNTEAKVKEFQSSKGLSADGVVGPNTWDALLGGGSGGGGGDAGVSGDRAELAQQILNDDGIVLYNLCNDGSASPQKVIESTANGQRADTYQHGSVTLNKDMLEFMVGFGKTNDYRVTSITDCGHATNSAHYEGRAVDIDLVDGTKIDVPASGAHASDVAAAACRKYGATNVLTYRERSDHRDHVHCTF